MCSENESDELICPCCAYRANADDYEVYLSLVNESKTGRLFPIVICPKCGCFFTFKD